MSATLSALLLEAVCESLAEDLQEAAAGHCLRIDDVAHADTESLAECLSRVLPAFEVRVLARNPATDREITADRAVEIRNRKLAPFVLVVPAGTGDAASSLDNSFEPRALVGLLKVASGRLEARLGASAVSEHIRTLRTLTRGRRTVAAWSEFLAVVAESPTVATIGRELWRLGMIPDLGEDPTERFRANAHAAVAISRPARPTATIADRLAAAGVREGAARTRIQIFLDTQGAPLSEPMRWCHTILEHHPGTLTFEHWPLADAGETDLETLTADSFRKPDGSVERWCKLKPGVDDELVCPVGEDVLGVVVVRWKTRPTKSASVARWQLDLVPPDELRNEDSDPLETMRVKGDKRQATLKVQVAEDELVAGNRFVVRITALDENDEVITLVASGERAIVDSDEFDIVWMDEQVERDPRRTSAESVPGAVLGAALDGIDAPVEELGLDPKGAVLGVRLDRRRQAQIRISPVVVALEQLTTRDPAVPRAFTSVTVPGAPIQVPDGVEWTTPSLPQELMATRTAVLEEVARRHHSSLVETVTWDDALFGLLGAYLASYERFLRDASGDALADLLLLDTLTVETRTAAGRVRSIVVLPTHPLRMAWIAMHDRTLRSWAVQLADFDRVSERRLSLDLALVGKITPANLPFTVLDRDRQVLVYVEEITHGCGLYLPIDVPEPELVADLVCESLGVTRGSVSTQSRARQTGDRLASYSSAHPGHSALRLLGVNLGPGDVIAGAIRSLVTVDPDSEDAPGTPPPRFEVVGYTDYAPFANRLPALRRLQSEFRAVPWPGAANHLSPVLSLSVRPTLRVVEDEEGAHFAVFQDVSQGEVAVVAAAPERAPSLHDLLTSTLTVRVEGDAGDTRWETLPALRSRPEADPDLAGAHRAHQSGIARALGHDDGLPAIRVGLDADTISRIRSVHARSDWVVTIDRFLGLDVYDDAESAGLGTSYVLDYAPDFVEGLTDRLTVTTAHRSEILRVLAAAMRELGLADVGTESMVLDLLAMVSGRLALRLITSNNQAREAVSLAALMAHLRDRGQLDGRIVVPVDAHPEIFGPAVRAIGEGARRCDLLLVRITDEVLEIECIEVKARQHAIVPTALAERIVEQLKDTETILNARFFAADPPRVDQPLQRARLIGLLHHYADRARITGLVGDAEAATLHARIDRLEEHPVQPEITLRGYVISLEGRAGFPDSYRGVPITVLTAEDLGRVGFSTVREVTERSVSGYQPLVSSVPDTGTSVESGSAGAASRPEEPRPEGPDPGEPRWHETTPGGPRFENPGSPPGHDRGSGAPTGEPAPGRIPPVSSGPDAPSSPGTPHASAAPDVAPAGAPGGPADDRTGGPQPGGDAVLATGQVRVVLGSDASGQDVPWSVSTQGSPHAFIIGIPGQGKSVTTRRIIRSFAEQALPSLIFDFHGDMAAAPPAGATVFDVSEGLPFSPFELRSAAEQHVNSGAFEVAEIVAYVCGLGEVQRNHVYRGMKKAYQDCGWTGGNEGDRLPTIGEFAEAVEAVEVGAKGANARARLTPLTDFGLFQADAITQFDPTGGGGGLILDVSGLPLETVQLAASAFVLRKVYRQMFQWGESSDMRLAVILDEAHRLAKDRTLPKLMKEGRKYGMSVVVASQGIGDFHKDVLQNAGIKIVFRTNFPASKTVAGFLRGRAGQDLSLQIEQLGVGEAYVATADDAQARKVYMSS